MESKTEKILPCGRFDGTYRTVTAPPGSYFAAINSGRGFVSYFDELIGARCEGRMIIKGGPGTGKSRMLYEAADIAAKAGAEVEYYFCSSDPDSLDGIAAVFPSGMVVGLQDGTSPHAAEATLPGARDCLFDLGAFWNRDVLKNARGEIEELGNKKSRAWRDAFECLAAARALRGAAGSVAAGVMDGEHIKKAAARLAGEARRAGERMDASMATVVPARCGGVMHTPHRALGMRGAVALGSIYDGAGDVFVMSDELLPGSGAMFVTAVAERVVNGGMAARVSPDPIVPEQCAAVRIGRVVITADSRLPDGTGAAVHRVGMRRFAAGGAGSVRGEYMRLMSLAEAAVTAALAAMARAADAHFALEEIYMSAMDFEAKESAAVGAVEEFFRRYL